MLAAPELVIAELVELLHELEVAPELLANQNVAEERLRQAITEFGAAHGLSRFFTADASLSFLIWVFRPLSSFFNDLIFFFCFSDMTLPPYKFWMPEPTEWCWRRTTIRDRGRPKSWWTESKRS